MSGDWRESAACDGQAHLFFTPDDGESPVTRAARLAAAMTLCGSCPVRADCLSYAVSGGMRCGIFAGVDFGNPGQRQRAAREAAAA